MLFVTFGDFFGIFEKTYQKHRGRSEFEICAFVGDTFVTGNVRYRALDLVSLRLS